MFNHQIYNSNMNEEERRRHERAWNDPPMFSYDQLNRQNSNPISLGKRYKYPAETYNFNSVPTAGYYVSQAAAYGAGGQAFQQQQMYSSSLNAGAGGGYQFTASSQPVSIQPSASRFNQTMTGNQSSYDYNAYQPSTAMSQMSMSAVQQQPNLQQQSYTTTAGGYSSSPNSYGQFVATANYGGYGAQSAFQSFSPSSSSNQSFNSLQGSSTVQPMDYDQPASNQTAYYAQQLQQQQQQQQSNLLNRNQQRNYTNYATNYYTTQ